MPTSTFTLTADNQDGEAYLVISNGTPLVSSINYAKNYDGVKYGSGAFYTKKAFYARFAGITIPQSTTINSATLKIYATSQSGTPAAKVFATNDGNPPTPANASVVINGTNVIPTIFQTFTVTQGGLVTSKDSYNLKNIDVTSIVQTLVNTYDYSNDPMLFYLRDGTTTIWVYDKNWGTTKDAELVIDYVGAASVSRAILNTISKFWG